ncbi:hypothetical protein ACIPSE_12605 [Streptomyces sp. NPDC090106]|uniref:hypothetical protein n=1 Tax=Streptomyces sp. NPDC090106 TaxID=3365946 RepID=UPI00382EA0AE
MIFRFTASDLWLLLGALGGLALAITCLALSVHALVHGRMPGRPLQRAVRFPRLWGAGVLLAVFALGRHSTWLLAGAVGIVIFGHVVKRAR